MSAPAVRDRSAVIPELEGARERVAQLEAELATLSSPSPISRPTSTASPSVQTDLPAHVHQRKEKDEIQHRWPLSQREYKRYGRQMMLASVGLPGQLKLKHAHVLVVGAGGLGCPVLLYLAAAGVGEITILDHDEVELSNLHRQVLHTEARVGLSKAESAKVGLQALNSDIVIHARQIAFTPSLFHSPACPPSVATGSFTLILDCTDNPATRHFLNAYAVANRIPLVSGGAVRAEGTVGAYAIPLPSPPAGEEKPERAEQDYGPCYACIFPPSPPAAGPPSWSSPSNDDEEKRERERVEDAYYERLSLAGTGACSDEGVLGILCGVVGIGMAGEAVKVILGTARPSLHLFSPLSPTSPYRTIKIRPRKPTCPACGSFPSSTSSSSAATSTPTSRWEDFLSSADGTWPGWTDPLCALPGVGALGGEGREDERIRVGELRRRLKDGEKLRIVDTRPPAEYGMANLEGSLNIPFPRLLKDPSLALASYPSSSSEADPLLASSSSPPPDCVTFVCRRGNDSLLASRALKRYLTTNGTAENAVRVEDVVGGLTAWAAEGEEGFPVY
ncbi:hypothetical protein JCM8547_001211 [Rhodosporidiobolus lusitaniae]